MLLIIFLGLIAKLALVSGDCDVGTQKVKDYNFTRVGICELSWLMEQVTLKTLVWVYKSFVFPLNK